MLRVSMSQRHFTNYWWFALSFLVITSDQITKYFAVYYLNDPGSIRVTPYFNLTLLFNRGAAFSFLSHAGGWQHWFFGCLSISVCLYIIFILPSIKPREKLNLSALSLILGGACGNLWDRFNYGYVIDFLHFHYYDWHFAVFNIADSAISVGAGLLILAILTSKEYSR